MKAKGRFISLLLVVDTFFVSYAFGFHSRHVLIVDPKLPPVVKKVEAKALPTKVITKIPVSKDHSKNLHDKKGHTKNAAKPKDIGKKDKTPTVTTTKTATESVTKAPSKSESSTKTELKVAPKVVPKTTTKVVPKPVKKVSPKTIAPKAPTVSDGKNES
ncbi:MAG: hypothetical protein IAF58_00055 [Leptolyngbya sp.]|nr:hypothetical protein [Candidatus Melainabacteria bacterium]